MDLILNNKCGFFKTKVTIIDKKINKPKTYNPTTKASKFKPTHINTYSTRFYCVQELKCFKVEFNDTLIQTYNHNQPLPFDQ